MMASEEKTFRLDEQRNVRVNKYKGIVYFHFHDIRKSKSCTLTIEAFEKLLSKGNRMVEFARTVQLSSTNLKSSESE